MRSRVKYSPRDALFVGTLTRKTLKHTDVSPKCLTNNFQKFPKHFLGWFISRLPALAQPSPSCLLILNVSCFSQSTGWCVRGRDTFARCRRHDWPDGAYSSAVDWCKFGNARVFIQWAWRYVNSRGRCVFEGEIETFEIIHLRRPSGNNSLCM